MPNNHLSKTGFRIREPPASVVCLLTSTPTPATEQSSMLSSQIHIKANSDFSPGSPGPQLPITVFLKIPNFCIKLFLGYPAYLGTLSTVLVMVLLSMPQQIPNKPVPVSFSDGLQ